MRTSQLGGRSTDRKSPIGSTYNQWGMKKTPLIEVSLYHAIFGVVCQKNSHILILRII
ncbi:hypothetical protein [Lysinibacillus fusiformis]